MATVFASYTTRDDLVEAVKGLSLSWLRRELADEDFRRALVIASCCRVECDEEPALLSGVSRAFQV